MTITPIGRDEAQRQAAEELAKPGYQHESFVDSAYRHVQEFLGDLLDSAAGGGSAGGIIAAVVIVLVLAAIVFVIVWSLRKTSRGTAGRGGDLFGAQAMTAAEHRAAAEALAAEGRWGEAVQERLRAIARDLEDRALVDGAPGRTADELATDAGRALPAFADELSRASRDFDDVTYGGVPGTPQAYQVMSALDEKLRQARPVALT